MPTRHHGGDPIDIHLNIDYAAPADHGTGVTNVYQRTNDYNWTPLHHNDRRAALERVRAAIDAELGDRPDPTGELPGDGAVPDSRELARVVGALARAHIGTGSVHYDGHFIRRAARYGVPD